MSKPPAKRRAKRKTAESDNTDGAGESMLASLDLNNSKIGPKKIAAALLSLLPENATRQHALAQKLTKAFPLVITELDNRAHVLTRASESQGSLQPIAFRFPSKAEGNSEEEMTEEECWDTLNLPEEAFIGIMKFLTGKEITHKASVCKCWLAASRSPLLWERLDDNCGIGETKLNMTKLQDLLRRPQFANLKHFSMPRKGVKLSQKSIKTLSQLCPHVEEINLGYDGHVTGAKPKDADLISMAENFSNLNTIHTNMWAITSQGIVSAAKIVEASLIDLRIRGDCITEHYFGDSALEKIASCCFNLQYFAYKISGFYYNVNRDGLSGKGILSLIDNCRRLEVLELHKAQRVGRETFEEILQKLAVASESSAVAKAAVSNDDDNYALRNIILAGYPFVIAGAPLRIIEESSDSDWIARSLKNP